ncbi:MAG TPA: hypothetical protein VGR40_08620 [Candidatus Binatus sp.]|nr:hypothetical protein [Candidatus Binatus sp.]
MVELTVRGDQLHVEILGWSKLLGFKSSIDVPLVAIKSVDANAELPKFRWTDIRALGTSIPGAVAVGTYWIGSPHRWVFLDVRRSSKDVVSVEIEGEFYSRLIVEVKDAPIALALLQSSLAGVQRPNGKIR